MTAEIGLLNKTSVVLAADSAATISSHNKVFNNANKLFPLSKTEPVGIMVYNVSSWMGIPLEIIIKGFTKKLATTSYSTLLEYRNNFVKYLKENFHSIISNSQINEFVESKLYQMLDELNERYKSILEDALFDKNPSSEEKIEISEKTFLDVLEGGALKSNSTLPDFEDYSFDNFKEDFQILVDKILPGFYATSKIQQKPEHIEKIYKLLHNEIISDFYEDEDYTGIVIAGYGVDEIYPTICEIKLGEIISKRLRYNFSSKKTITNKNSGIVMPLAQRDMVDTFFRGINPKLFYEIGETLKIELLEAAKKINEKYPQIPLSELSKILLEARSNCKSKILDFTKTNYVRPIVKSIGYLRKEDLIEFAESLINITSLKLKTNSEIQSVGGPIDIAIITKYEGFVWVKRKDIVNRELNSDFYTREYLKMK